MSMTVAEISLSRISVAWRLAGIVVTLVTVASWWMVFGNPTLESRAAMARRHELVNSLRASSREIQSRLATAASELERWEHAEQMRRARTVARHDESGLLQWLNERTDTSGLTLRDFRPSSRTTEGEYEGRGVALSSQGSFEGICRFLDQLRGYSRMNRVTSLELSPLERGGDMYQCAIQVMLFSHASAPGPDEKRG